MNKKGLWKGFTLIEITAVAGIVSALSVSTYMGAQKGRESQCLNNLKQIYQAISMFEMDNGHLPDAKFFPSSASDPKGLHNILNLGAQEQFQESIFFCPSLPEQLNIYGTNYIWNDELSGKSSDTLPRNTWLMTEMTAVRKDIPGPHTGRFAILYVGGNAQTGERISFPEVAPPQKPPAETREIKKPEEKKLPESIPSLNILTKKEARAGEEVKISVSLSDGKGGYLPIKPGVFSIKADDPSASVPSSFEVKNETSSFEFSSVFKKTGKVRIKIKEESSGIEGECEVNILPESISKFTFSNFPLLWEAGKPQIIYINACDKEGNRTDDYNGEVVIFARKGKVSPEKGMITKGVWPGELTLTESSENNVLYIGGERGIFGASPEFKVKNSSPVTIEISSESKGEPVAGMPYDINLEVKDIYENRCIDYTGEIDIELPEGATADTKKVILGQEDRGMKKISITFFRAGDKKIQVSSKDNIKGEKEFYVNSGQLYSFSIGDIGTQGAGKPFNIVIKAKDRWGNPVKGFYLKEPSGVVEYIKRDTSSGMWMETVVIKKAGQYSIIVEDRTGVSGSSNVFNVKPSSPEKVEITGIPLELSPGMEYTGSITVKDRFDNVITDYKDAFTGEASDGLKIEINENNIKIIPEKTGYYKLTIKDMTNTNLSTEKHLVVISEKK